MTRVSRQVLVTGAAGFIGARLVRRLLDEPRFADAQFTLGDLTLDTAPSDPRVRSVEGDFSDPAVRGDLLAETPDLVFHLASILGGAAEADYEGSRRVNLDGTLSLLEALRKADSPPRVVFASSIAVFGPDTPAIIDDDTPTNPSMIYGAQKRMIEVALEQFTARGWIDGLALRLPGIVARPGIDPKLKSAFLNAIFHAVKAGEDYTLPVSAAGTTWMISVPACIEAFVHAGLLDQDQLGPRRAFTLPAQQVAFGDLVKTLKRLYPDSASTIRFAPQAEIEGQFARQPPLKTPLADRLGFRHDGDLVTLARRALGEMAAR